jgi:hypothetical protein
MYVYLTSQAHGKFAIWIKSVETKFRHRSPRSHQFTLNFAIKTAICANTEYTDINIRIILTIMNRIFLPVLNYMIVNPLYSSFPRNCLGISRRIDLVDSIYLSLPWFFQADLLITPFMPRHEQVSEVRERRLRKGETKSPGHFIDL